MDVEVEFQLLGEGVTVSDGTGNVLLPQIEELPLVPTVEGSQEVLLWRRHQTEAHAEGMSLIHPPRFSHPPNTLDALLRAIAESPLQRPSGLQTMQAEIPADQLCFPAPLQYPI